MDCSMKNKNIDFLELIIIRLKNDERRQEFKRKLAERNEKERKRKEKDEENRLLFSIYEEPEDDDPIPEVFVNTLSIVQFYVPRKRHMENTQYYRDWDCFHRGKASRSKKKSNRSRSSFPRPDVHDFDEDSYGYCEAGWGFRYFWD